MKKHTAKSLEQQIEKLLAKLTLDEKLCLIRGRTDSHTGDVPRLGIQGIHTSDGPQGIRLEDGRTTTALPCGQSLSCTFSPKSAEKAGRLLGRECRALGVQALLGPGMNLMRTPLNGRSFEYFGEDPVLAGTIAAGYVKGIQSQQVAACPKHLALNNQEICRTVGSSNIDERTLRELYLRSFDIAVREARPWMMMSSYNRINGVYASQCGHTQQDVIKDIDGFDGVMVSDWGGVHDTYQPAMNGLDLEMGSSLENQYFDAPLRRLVEQGDVPMAVIDEKVRRILRLILRTKGLHNHPIDAPKGEVDTARNHRESRELAEDGMVLLQNDKSFLPLNPNKLKNILVLGPNADVAHNMGRLQETGGSGAVHPAYEVTPLEGIRKFLGNLLLTGGRRRTVFPFPVYRHNHHICLRRSPGNKLRCTFIIDVDQVFCLFRKFIVQDICIRQINNRDIVLFKDMDQILHIRTGIQSGFLQSCILPAGKCCLHTLFPMRKTAGICQCHTVQPGYFHCFREIFRKICTYLGNLIVYRDIMVGDHPEHIGKARSIIRILCLIVIHSA